MIFKNRTDAGEQLCKLLEPYKKEPVVLYALPRGGVAVAEPIARFLQVPLQLLITRKIGHPFESEWAIAAVSESGFLVKNPNVLDYVSEQWLESAKTKEMKEIQRRKKVYLQQRQESDLRNKTVIIVDDGIATGLTLEAGILEVKSRHPQKIVVAVPVSPREIAAKFKGLVDSFIAVDIPLYYRGSVGSYYDAFPQVTDEEVMEILRKFP